MNDKHLVENIFLSKQPQVRTMNELPTTMESIEKVAKRLKKYVKITALVNEIDDMWGYDAFNIDQWDKIFAMEENHITTEYRKWLYDALFKL